MGKFFSKLFAGAAAKKQLVIALILVLAAGLGVGLGTTVFRKPDAASPALEASPDAGQDRAQPDSDGADADPEDEPEGTEPEEPDPVDLQALLGGVPYYGDVGKCKMTAEQAAAYAQVIADGIAGRYSKDDMQFTFEESSDLFFWEIPNEVFGGSSCYLTDRANVILADLEANGVPYLYVFSSLIDSRSYSVYGWDGGQAKFVTGAESFESRFDSGLYESGDGAVVSKEVAYFGWASCASETYAFSNGGVNLAYSWDVSVVWDDESGEVLRVTMNGETTDYPTSADESKLTDIADGASPCQPVDMEKRSLPYAPFSEVESRPATLRQMLDALNNYASELSGGKSRPVVLPELSGTQLMAKAMLEKLSELSFPEGYWKGEPEAYLLDMNADGTPELVCYDDDIEDSAYGGGYHVFRWDGRELYEHEFEYGAWYPGYLFCGYNITKYRNEYALAYVDIIEGNTLYNFNFLDRRTELLDGESYYYSPLDDEEIYTSYFLYNGKDISEEEFNQLCDEYDVDSLPYWSHVKRTDLPEAKTALQKLLMG